MTDPDGELAITVRGLRRTYGSGDKVVRAVDGIDLDIRKGEIFALLGPNGAGKTTTVEILEGFRKRDSGNVSVLGRDPASPTREWRSRIGIVMQNAHDLDLITVREVVTSFAGFYPEPRPVDDVLAAVGLAAKADTRARNLSGGQRRRLDVALGIVGNPELVFLDEPTTGFDPEARRQFWDLIRVLHEEGTTILLTTHYLDEAEQLAERVGVIASGQLIEVSTPDRLGGRAESAALVSWVEDGVRRSMPTDAPTRTVSELAARLGGEVPELTVSRPTLEDAYLALIAPHVATDADADLAGADS